MANHKQAMKRHRQSLVRKDRNRAGRSALKTSIRKVEESEKAKPEERETVFRKAVSTLSKARQKHLLHWKTAARKIGRLSKAVAKLGTNS